MTAAVSAVAKRGMTIDRRLQIAILVICLFGIADAGYLTYIHYAGLKPICNLGGGCEKVQSSTYSKLDGIPVAVLGLAGYLVILAALAIGRELGRATAFGTALIGFGFSLYLTYREAFTIHAYCQWCLGSAVMMTVLVVLTAVRFLRDPGTSTRR
jgi:uncharacterized membrane protein